MAYAVSAFYDNYQLGITEFVLLERGLILDT